MNLISLAESLDSEVSEEVLNYLGVQPKDTEKEIIQILAKKSYGNRAFCRIV